MHESLLIDPAMNFPSSGIKSARIRSYGIDVVESILDKIRDEYARVKSLSTSNSELEIEENIKNITTKRVGRFDKIKSVWNWVERRLEIMKFILNRIKEVLENPQP